MSLLRIDSSAAIEGSITRDLTDRIVTALGETDVVKRDLAANPLPQIDHAWAVARVTPDEERSEAQRAALELSDELIAEMQAADTIVIGVPVYNFSVPAALKAWVDLVARVGVTFRYSEAGPEGLVKGKRVVLAMASGGTAAGSEADFASTYMRHVLSFMGMTDVEMIAADALAIDAEGTIAKAHNEIEALTAKAA